DVGDRPVVAKMREFLRFGDRELTDPVGQCRCRRPVVRLLEFSTGPINRNVVRLEPVEVVEQKGDGAGAWPRQINQVAIQDDEINAFFESGVEYFLRSSERGVDQQVRERIGNFSKSRQRLIEQKAAGMQKAKMLARHQHLPG